MNIPTRRSTYTFHFPHKRLHLRPSEPQAAQITAPEYHQCPQTARSSAHGRDASLFYTSLGLLLAPGPKVFHAQARSCMRCRPNQRVCGPGGSARFGRFT